MAGGGRVVGLGVGLNGSVLLIVGTKGVVERVGAKVAGKVTVKITAPGETIVKNPLIFLFTYLDHLIDS